MDNKEIINLLKLYMQKPSFMDLVSANTDSWKECLKDDMEMISSWKLNHEKDYAHFKAEVMHASYGDYTAYTKIHLDIVTKKGNEQKFIYERIPSSLEFFYRLPWDWQCTMRTLSLNSNDIELATKARSLYLKICLTQDEIMHNIEMIGKKRDAFVMCLFYGYLG